jgi:hypothetical protein
MGEASLNIVLERQQKLLAKYNPDDRNTTQVVDPPVDNQ